MLKEHPDGEHSVNPDVKSESSTQSALQVVAIGASAGGLDALEKLFAGLPDDSGAAFVVIQHLSPDHKSMMAGLLARSIVVVGEGERDERHLTQPGEQLVESFGGVLQVAVARRGAVR